jgi:hypothetical protein
MNPSSITYFRAKTHLYRYRLDVPVVQNRFTTPPNIAQKVLAGVAIFLSSANARALGGFIAANFRETAVRTDENHV